MESPSSRRAWIEIPVPGQFESMEASPSSRRAWIEIASGARKYTDVANVALLAEGVDRNYKRKSGQDLMQTSPSSRRAWIEIGFTMCGIR